MTNTRAGSARDDDLSDFRQRTFGKGEDQRIVHTSGSGPAVVVMPEMPGISPDVARFARWVRDAGFTVFLPSLFGVDGAYERHLRLAITPRYFRLLLLVNRGGIKEALGGEFQFQGLVIKISQLAIKT